MPWPERPTAPLVMVGYTTTSPLVYRLAASFRRNICRTREGGARVWRYGVTCVRSVPRTCVVFLPPVFRGVWV
jgi:hypothetical protein